jgi:tripartite-type tricarboxylate transporter receptor subunit TctC
MRAFTRSCILVCILAAATIAVGLGGVPGALAADYPERPIHLIVPFQAGSVSDNTARILAA